jgi:hypothetical protein
MIASTGWNTDTMPGPNDVSAEAIDWLAGRIRWEHILRELHDRASREPSIGAVDDINVALDALTAPAPPAGEAPDAGERSERAA